MTPAWAGWDTPPETFLYPGSPEQIIPSTWYANGGTEHPYPPAANAPPLEQEKVARNVMASQGIGAWHGCG